MRAVHAEKFDVPDGYLNTASIGVPPSAVADAVAAAVDAWRGGAARPPDYDAPVERARAGFAALVGVAPDRVALGAAVSGQLGLIAASLPERARVLVAEGEFTSVTWPFAAQHRRGVTVEEVPLERIGERAPEFDLVAVSVVQSADGRVVDLAALRAAREAGCAVVLDATQSLGWFDADLTWADAVLVAGYKWLLSPRGAAWMALPAGSRLEPVAHQAGWSAGADQWESTYGLPLRLAEGPRGLGISPAWLSHVGAAVALPWLAGLDRAAVQAHCVGLADAFRAELGMGPGGSAIVSVRREGAVERLTSAGVVVSARAGAARLAFALYNTEADVEMALRALAASQPAT
ncbi:aminotransferase class V-fold PLP-dependent enzyme [Pseudonocardia humida]|uniref:Aminotransferase class V-fold PLP-dependent enzyme n=1 Tax=Pseudonocardia humida TaxID=2800819 RepID=A0ABT0ZUM6_9PSEU|nr:aminotransferase class V-fold PLP-dependent enzyme [Pseudonocardia humida]MCO1654441.1 aminotransferase class V-fold PLP-dependent enzyme [Pseudonocardia humida]